MGKITYGDGETTGTVIGGIMGAMIVFICAVWCRRLYCSSAPAVAPRHSGSHGHGGGGDSSGARVVHGPAAGDVSHAEAPAGPPGHRSTPGRHGAALDAKAAGAGATAPDAAGVSQGGAVATGGPSQWTRFLDDASGCPYWYNEASATSTWTDPAAEPPAAA